jgi:PAS domain S-box-containing protein
MDFLFFDDIQKKPYHIPALIVVSSITILILNIYGLMLGITNVLPHLFYIPIILTAYFYPRRGVLFAICLSFFYCVVSFAIFAATLEEMFSALARSGVFIIIAGVVSYLSGEMLHDTQMCRRLVSVVNFSGDAIVGETRDGVVTDWNTGAERLYGYTSREMVGSSILRLIPPERHEGELVILERIGQGEVVERVETERITKDGTRIQVSLSLSPILDNTGNVVGISAIAHDVTERQRFQNEILKTKDRWELTFNAVPDMIAIIDARFRIIQVNKAMADRLGVSPEDAVGLTCYEVVHHTGRPPDFCPHKLLLRDGENHSAEIHEETINGDFLLTVSPIRDPSGSVLGSVHILRDISDRKRAETRVQESETKFREIFNAANDAIHLHEIN